MPKKFTAKLTLNISDENTSFIPVAWKAFGHFPEMTMTPEDVICQEFQIAFDNKINRFRLALEQFLGAVNQEQFDAINEQLKNAIEIECKFEDVTE